MYVLHYYRFRTHIISSRPRHRFLSTSKWLFLRRRTGGRGRTDGRTTRRPKIVIQERHKGISGRTSASRRVRPVSVRSMLVSVIESWFFPRGVEARKSAASMQKRIEATTTWSRALQSSRRSQADFCPNSLLRSAISSVSARGSDEAKMR